MHHYCAISPPQVYGIHFYVDGKIDIWFHGKIDIWQYNKINSSS